MSKKVRLLAIAFGIVFCFAGIFNSSTCHAESFKDLRIQSIACEEPVSSRTPKDRQLLRRHFIIYFSGSTPYMAASEHSLDGKEIFKLSLEDDFDCFSNIEDQLTFTCNQDYRTPKTKISSVKSAAGNYIIHFDFNLRFSDRVDSEVSMHPTLEFSPTMCKVTHF